MGTLVPLTDTACLYIKKTAKTLFYWPMMYVYSLNLNCKLALYV